MRWDSFVPNGQENPQPMVYIKPKEGFDELIKKYDYTFNVQVDGTGMNYDLIEVVGMINSSEIFPNFRPNFFKETGYYVVVLRTDWLGYPKNNGKLTLKIIPDNPDDELNQIENYINTDQCNRENKLSNMQISSILIFILIIFGIFLFVSLYKMKKK